MNRAGTVVTVWFAAMAVLSKGVRSAAAPAWRRQVTPTLQRPLAFASAGCRLAMIPRARRAPLPPSSRRRLDVCMATMATRPPAVQDALAVVREELKQRGLDAFVIPSGDPHLSEYAADHFCRRAFISGFDGSAGTAVVTTTEALLWTDGRYFLQAEQQLGQDWKLMRDGQKGVPTLSSYLKDRLPAKAVVGLDPRVHTVKFVTSLAKTLAAKDVTVRPIDTSEQNPVDVAWGQQRPAAPRSPVRVHPLAFAGESVASKLDKIKAKMEEEGADVLVACVLDEVAWLLNIRGSDVPNCPLPVSYATVELVPSPANPKALVARPRIFVEDVKLGDEVKRHLAGANVEIRPYDEIFSHVSGLAAQGKKIWLDGDKSNYALLQAALGPGVAPQEVEDKATSKAVITKGSPITLLKAIKNRVELDGMRACHLRDGAAEVEFLAWLDKTLQQPGRSVSELEIDEVLTGFRAKRDRFLGLSFDTIAGAGPNGAIIHYRATPGSAALMDRTKMLLLDSGAQYEDGTTDVTRTMHFGEPTDFQKRCFTRVLQGNMAIDTAIFPEGTPGFVLDAYARRALWAEGLDYGHGTGHGVGAALNVHEGPQGISFNFANQTPLQPGMVLSNEPGFYQAGEFGIRIENLLVVVPATEGPSPKDPKQRQYLKFERLTHIPICKRLVVKELLSADEVRWLDDYHAQVWERVSPLIESQEAKDWLWDATRPL